MCIVLYTLFYVVLRTGFYVAGNFTSFAEVSKRELRCKAGLQGGLLQINGLGEAEVETTIDA